MHDPIWPATFEYMHPGATGCNLEIRSPFLDVRLARFTLALPVKPWLAEKGLLRAAMKGRLPRRVLRREKTPLPVSPVEAHIKRHTSRALPSRLHPEADRFVDSELWATTVHSTEMDALQDLRPLALSSFLSTLTRQMMEGVAYVA